MLRGTSTSSKSAWWTFSKLPERTNFEINLHCAFTVFEDCVEKWLESGLPNFLTIVWELILSKFIDPIESVNLEASKHFCDDYVFRSMFEAFIQSFFSTTLNHVINISHSNDFMCELNWHLPAKPLPRLLPNCFWLHLKVKPIFCKRRSASLTL